MCCGIFSSFAIVFLVIVGEVIKSGSDSIVLPSVLNETEDYAASKRHEIATNCLIGAGVYGGCCLLSVGCCFYRRVFPHSLENEALVPSEYSLN